VGDYISGPDDASRAIMHAYLDQIDFSALPFDDALRLFLLDFRRAPHGGWEPELE